MSCVPSPFDADADSDTEQPDAVFVTLCVSVWCSLILCDLLGVIVPPPLPLCDADGDAAQLPPVI